MNRAGNERTGNRMLNIPVKGGEELTEATMAAIGNCEQLLQEMQYIISIIPVDAQKYIRYVEMIEKEIALLKGWRKSDNKILKKIRENEAAKAQKEGASQKAEKQV